MIIEDENTKVGENVGRMYNILALFFRKLLSCFLERTLAPNSSAMSVGRSVVGRLVVTMSVYLFSFKLGIKIRTRADLFWPCFIPMVTYTVADCGAFPFCDS